VDAEIHFPILSINSRNNRNHIIDSSEEVSTIETMENNTPSQSLFQYLRRMAIPIEPPRTLSRLVADFTSQMLQQNADLKRILTHSLERSDRLLLQFTKQIERMSLEHSVSSHESLALSVKRQRVDDTDAVLVTADTTTITSITDITDETNMLFSFNQQVKSQLDIEFTYASIDAQNLWSPFELPSSLEDSFQKISLAALNKLRISVHDEKFFPKEDSLFLRQPMRDVMYRLVQTKEGMSQDDPDAKRWVLLGSPGIGKSLLFFLGAVCKVVLNKDHILYFRKARNEQLSVFYLFHDTYSHHNVNVFFKRFSIEEERENNKLRSLEELLSPVYRAVNQISGMSRKVLLFLDGPNHGDESDDTLCKFDYLCTSGGHPLPKSSDTGLRLWVLNGWNLSDMTQALRLVHGTRDKKAKEIYNVCGGCMREAVVALTDDGMANVMRGLIGKIQRLGEQGIELISKETETTDRNYDRLRMMFVSTQNQENCRSDVANIVHIVDSAFVLDLLRVRLSLKQLLDVYMVSKLINSRSAEGNFYEQYWHKWFMTNTPCGITVLKSKGNWKDSILQLTKDEQYWIPEKDNFPFIDAAIVCGETLFGVQYTIKPKKDSFDAQAFSTFFVSKVHSNMLANGACRQFKKVVIVYVVPSAANFKKPSLINYHASDLEFIVTVVEADPQTGKTPEFPFINARSKQFLQHALEFIARFSVT
jgi:hypothetical protein